MFRAWQPIPLNLCWADVEPGCVLLHTDNDAVVVDARRDKDSSKQIVLRMQRLDGERFEQKVKSTEEIGTSAYKELGQQLVEDERIRAVAMPAIVWREDTLFSPRNLMALLATTLLITLMVGSLGPGQFYIAFLAGGAVGVWVRRIWKSGNRLEIMAPDRLGITMETILPYALTLEQGRLWVPPSASANRRQLAFQRVEAIRNHYLKLREDIAYRIECSALFDSAVPTTAEFEAALVAFDDVTDATATDEIDALASDVEVTFNVAQANAERLGIAHLPNEARADARRAGKAARLAAEAATQGEREASLTQVKRILESLSLYYLPTLDERLAIEAGPRVAES